MAKVKKNQMVGKVVLPTDPVVMACKRKTRFPTRLLAEDGALLANASGTVSGAKLEPYHCPNCDGYHIGAPTNLALGNRSMEGKVLSRMKVRGKDAVFALPLGSMVYDDSAMELGELIAYRTDSDPIWRDRDGARVANWRDMSAIPIYTPKDWQRFLLLMETYLAEHVAPVVLEEAPELKGKIDLSALKGCLPELELFEGERIWRDDKGKFPYLRETRECRCGASIQVHTRLIGKSDALRKGPSEAAPVNSRARLALRGPAGWLCEACALHEDEGEKRAVAEETAEILEHLVTETPVEVAPVEVAKLPEQIEEAMLPAETPKEEPPAEVAVAPLVPPSKGRALVEALGAMMDDVAVSAGECRGATWMLCKAMLAG